MDSNGNLQNRKPCVIFDIDGVIFEYLNVAYEEFYKHIGNLIPQKWAVNLVKSLHQEGISIVFLTARDVRFRSITKYTLDQLFDFKYKLYMRADNDLRQDFEIKQDYVPLIQEQYNILFVVDDNLNNCNMFKSQGLTTLQVM